MSSKAAYFFITLFLLIVQGHTFFLAPIVNPEVNYDQPKFGVNLADWRDYGPMLHKRAIEPVKIESPEKPSRVRGSHMLKQPFLRFDFLRRNFFHQRL